MRLIFEVVTVEDHWPRSLEQMGTKRKFWCEDDAGRHWLFKYARAATGEDWAEKLAECLCERLGLPHARYELAQCQGKPGTVSLTFLKREEQLILGNQLLGTVDREYAHRRTQYGNSFHTVAHVLMSLAGVAAPMDWRSPTGIVSGLDVFVGYLLLDALIGNGDRHDENWGVVAEATGVQRALAPTFDHASSLGRELTDEARRVRLTTRDQGRSLAAYAQRARSALYHQPGDARPLGTLEAFVAAAAHRPSAARHWLSCLEALTDDDIETGLDRIPRSRLSQDAKDFAAGLIACNRSRLRDATKQFL